MTVSRREFFTQFGRQLAAGIPTPQWDRNKRDKQGQQKGGRTWTRPPGALPEPQFLEACTHCVDCINACPHHAIRRLGPEFSENEGTPAVIPTESPCYLCEDMPCIAACKPQALLPTAIGEVRMGTAVLIESECYCSQGQPCEYCVERCPLGEAAIKFDVRGIPVINADTCAGCGVCAFLCPSNAIKMDCG